MGGTSSDRSRQKISLDECGLRIAGCSSGVLEYSGDVNVIVESQIRLLDPCRVPRPQLGEAHLDVIITDVTSGDLLTDIDDEEVGKELPNDLLIIGQ